MRWHVESTQIRSTPGLEPIKSFPTWEIAITLSLTTTLTTLPETTPTEGLTLPETETTPADDALLLLLLLDHSTVASPPASP